MLTIKARLGRIRKRRPTLRIPPPPKTMLIPTKERKKWKKPFKMLKERRRELIRRGNDSNVLRLRPRARSTIWKTDTGGENTGRKRSRTALTRGSILRIKTYIITTGSIEFEFPSLNLVHVTCSQVFEYKTCKTLNTRRSYFRCTTQKCPVKKRVERSFEDPSVVVTTYEGQHNHRIPVALRGHVEVEMFAPSSMLSTPEGTSSFSHQELVPRLYGYGGDVSDHLRQNLGFDPPHQFADYGLLGDVIPKQQP